MPRRKEPRIPDAVLDQLLAGADPKTAFDPNGLIDDLKKALAERVLNAEMDHRLISGSPGGLSGFIDKFKSVGLGSEVATWLGRSDGAALAGPQVERALGSTALGGVASRLGLGSGV